MDDAYWTIAYFFVFFNACLYTVFNLVLGVTLLYALALCDDKFRRIVYEQERAKEWKTRTTRFE